MSCSRGSIEAVSTVITIDVLEQSNPKLVVSNAENESEHVYLGDVIRAKGAGANPVTITIWKHPEAYLRKCGTPKSSKRIAINGDKWKRMANRFRLRMGEVKKRYFGSLEKLRVIALAAAEATEKAEGG